MARIVIDARIINSSTGRYVERLLTHLQDLDKDNEYIVLVPTKDLGFWKPTSQNFTLRSADFKNYSLAEQTGFLKFLNSLDADLVHFCMPQQPVFYKRPHITTIHDLTLLKTYNSDKNWFVFHFKQLVGSKIFRKIGHTSKHLIAISEFTKKEFVSHARINPDKVTVIYEAAAQLDVAPEAYPGIDDGDQFLMYVGSQSDYKNIRRLIEAHQTLRVKHPELKLVLIGSINEAARRNKEWVEKRGMEDVIFTGYVPDAQVNWLYSKCAAYVFPSLMEGFGLPGLEAMVSGAPVVSSNATCLPEVYGDAAEYFDPLNIDEMATAIDRVISDPKRREELIKLGQERAAKYSWERTAAQTLEVYQRMLI